LPYVPGPIEAPLNQVPIAVVFRDASGEPIPRPASRMLSIEDSGKQVRADKIRRVVSGAHLAEIGIFFDDTNTPAGVLPQARAAAAVIAEAGLSQGSAVTITTASHSVRLDASHDEAAIRALLARVEPHPYSDPKPVFPCPDLTPFQAFALIVENDPLILKQVQARGAACPDNPQASDDLALMMRGQASSVWDTLAVRAHETLASVRDLVAELAEQGGASGAKALWIVSRGFLAAPLDKEQELVAGDALRAGVTINTAEVEAENFGTPASPFVYAWPLRPPDAQARQGAMANLVVSSGGMRIASESGLANAIARWGMRPAIEYRVDYVPQDISATGEFHALHLSFSPPEPEVKIETRPGYFAPDPDALPALDRQLLDGAMRGIADEDAIPAILTQARIASGIGLTAHVNLGHVPFGSCGREHCQSLVLAAGVFRGDGNFETGLQDVVEMSLDDANLARLRARGVILSLELPLSSASERLRIVLQRQSDGKLSTFNRYISVH